MKVLHIITGLNQGGAERQLANLVSKFPNESEVFSVLNPGIMTDEIESLGVPVYHGGVARSTSLAWIPTLKRIIKKVAPDIVMGWMYHGNIAASMTCFLGYRGPIVWNVRHSVHDIRREKFSTRCVIRAGASLSGSPSRIVYNSLTAAVQHEQLGYAEAKRVIMPNGFDLERFQPDLKARDIWRAKLGIKSDEFLIGVIGRSHPMKNHLGWLKAFRMLVNDGLPVQCVMVGTGVAEPNGPAVMAVRELELTSRVRLLPATDSPELLYPAFDLLVMPSLWGEGFPNVVGESMACGVPALVTDVGDAATVIGDTGFVAKAGSPEAIAECARIALGPHNGQLKALGRAARERMVKCYSLESVAERYRSLLAGLT